MKTKRSTERVAARAALLLAVVLVAAACGSNSTSADEEAEPAQSDEESESMEDDGEMMEDGGTVTVTIENIADFAITDSGVFNTPDGVSDPGPAVPGDAYTFSVYAAPGQRLSFATMFVQTNDWFFAPDPAGIELYDAGGEPISGDITDRIRTFDAGTEIDQPVGEGADQAPRQAGPDTGADDEDGTAREIDRDAANYVNVSVTPADGGRFDVRIDNVSEMATVPSPLAPGVFAVHGDGAALFELGAPDAGNGMEALAEDGDPSELAEYLESLTGTPTPLAPGVFATHAEDVRLFDLGSPDAGLGLEALAEDGDPSALASGVADLDGIVHAGAFDTPDGASDAGPVLPGASYSFVVPLTEGTRLSFATMFVQSNDWIFATPAAGIEIGSLDGDITDQLEVVDVGTEIDQIPGFGADQAPRQSGPDTGADDGDTAVRIVDGRDAERYIRVTVSAS